MFFFLPRVVNAALVSVDAGLSGCLPPPPPPCDVRRRFCAGDLTRLDSTLAFLEHIRRAAFRSTSLRKNATLPSWELPEWEGLGSKCSLKVLKSLIWGNSSFSWKKRTLKEAVQLIRLLSCYICFWENKIEQFLKDFDWIWIQDTPPKDSKPEPKYMLWVLIIFGSEIPMKTNSKLKMFSWIYTPLLSDHVKMDVNETASHWSGPQEPRLVDLLLFVFELSAALSSSLFFF